MTEIELAGSEPFFGLHMARLHKTLQSVGSLTRGATLNRGEGKGTQHLSPRWIV